MLRAAGVLDPERILAVETGACPHTAIRDDITANLLAVEDLEADFAPLGPGAGRVGRRQPHRDVLARPRRRPGLRARRRRRRRRGPQGRSRHRPRRPARGQQDRPRALRRGRRRRRWPATASRPATAGRSSPSRGPTPPRSPSCGLGAGLLAGTAPASTTPPTPARWRRTSTPMPTRTETGLRVALRPSGCDLAAGLLTPRLLRREPAMAEVALVATGATLLGGDHIDVELSVGAGLTLRVRDTSATVAYHGRGHPGVRARATAGRPGCAAGVGRTAARARDRRRGRADPGRRGREGRRAAGARHARARPGRGERRDPAVPDERDVPEAARRWSSRSPSTRGATTSGCSARTGSSTARWRSAPAPRPPRARSSTSPNRVDW